MFTNFDKAIAAALTPVVLALLGGAGVSESMTVGEAVPVLILAGVGALAVYFIPNKS